MSALDGDALVVKVGGSILIDEGAYGRAAGALARLAGERRARIVAVVSARFGETDALLARARAIDPDPDADALDLLWSTGELQSVALLTMALRRRGLRAAALNVHEAGVQVTGGALRLNALALRAAMAAHDVAVVPGFLALDGQRVVTLGRGGSDLSAVLIATLLGASGCVLLKDVDGYFTSDPAVDRCAIRVPSLTFDAALALAGRGCPLVQERALAVAAAVNLPLVVRTIDGTGTTVSSGGQ